MAEKGTVVVIGSGTGGTACARYLARRDWRVVQIERDRWGGTCLWRGCIPKKALYHCASVVRGLRDADRFGIVADTNGSIDWQSVLAWKWHCQETFAGDQEGLAAGYGIELVHGEGRFVAPDAVAAGDKVYSADHIVIATGSEPVLPPIPGAVLADTSENALRYAQIPESLAIVGGGFIAMEMAGIYASFGTHVTVVTRPDRVLEMLDAELGETAVRCLSALGVEFITGCDVHGIHGEPGALVLQGTHGANDVSIEASRVILATGRRPCVCGLDPDAAAIATDDHGLVVVDEFLRTTNPQIWAVGDAAGGMMQTPVANLEGRTVARSIDEGVPAQPDCSAMPITCFTVPELASVGLSENRAREQGIDAGVSRVGLDATGAAIIDGETDGFIKLVSDNGTGVLIGAQIAAPQAADLIYSAAVAIRTGMTAADVGSVVAVHPSHAELVYYAGG